MSGFLPLIMPPIIYLGIILIYLFFSLIYYYWAPFKRYNVLVAARIATLLDLIAVTVVLLNSGGLDSPFWALWATVSLIYVIRFPFRWIEGIITAALFLITVEMIRSLVPTLSTAIPVTLIGVGLSLVVLIGSGLILVSSERSAIRKGITAERETIRRIVNTVHHEVNNPLTVLSGNLQLLKRAEFSEKEESWLNAMDEAIARIEDAVSQLRELEEERIISGEGLLERYPIQEKQPDNPLDDVEGDTPFQ